MARLTREEWNILLTHAYLCIRNKIFSIFDLPYPIRLGGGDLESWLSDCRKVQYSHRISTIKKTLNASLNLKTKIKNRQDIYNRKEELITLCKNYKFNND